MYVATKHACNFNFYKRNKIIVELLIFTKVIVSHAFTCVTIMYTINMYVHKQQLKVTQY